jgi:DNA-binding transcriptional MerR regulator
MRPLTIGALAKAAGVPTSTVRYYERLGILKPDGKRHRGDYRRYGPAALARLRFIRSAATTGLTLADAAELLDVADGTEPPCDPIRKRLVERFKAVTRQLHDLRRVQRTLKAALRNCCVGDDAGICGQVLTLRDGPARAAEQISKFRLTLHPSSTSRVTFEGDGNCSGATRRATPPARRGHRNER